jgi:signal transduction histidine kinase
MIRPLRPREALSRLYAILGAPGVLIALFSLLAVVFGLVILAREYDRLRQTGREAIRPVVSGWVRSEPIHYLGWTLADYADRWRRAPDAERSMRLEELRGALVALGDDLDRPERRSPLIEIVSMELRTRDGPVVASWQPSTGHLAMSSNLGDRIEILPASLAGPPIELAVKYRVAPEIERAASSLEVPYHRLLLALLGLSIYPLLCLVYMGMQARILRDRAAKQAAQEATLDLADRTCHELGNVAFVLSNERRNLSDHLDLVDRFIGEESEAVAAVLKRSGLSGAQAERLQDALRREYADRGIDPAIELRGGAEMARIVCRQIAVCSDYITLTVRELDGYLKQSALPVRTEPIAIDSCLDDALALLGPRLEAASVHVERVREGPEPARALADRRLLVHALVNLLKNAVEALAATTAAPRITLTERVADLTVRIEVADNGPGIPASELPHIFVAGYSTKGAGRGRGLAIVHDSVVAQGGQIEVESSPDKGSRFCIVLPRAMEASKGMLE